MSVPSDRAPRDTLRVLVVDDEKNIRLTVKEALTGMDLTIDTASDGAEALAMLDESTYWLMLLDIKMPGIDGMEVLRRLRKAGSEVRVVMITAHGTIANAVEAMKLGAVDFLQKPFTPQDIRSLVTRVMDRETMDARNVRDYEGCIELARRSMSHRDFDAARSYVERAIHIADAEPEAYNLVGVLSEIAGDRFEAQQFYRKALEIDPEFAPARANLKESVDPERKTRFFLGEARADKPTR